jgi:30S ribosomal protein S31
MGKGDKKSRRGKIWIGSHGVTRPRKKANAFVVKPKAEVKVKNEKPVLAEVAIAEVEEVKVKKAAAPKAKKTETAEPKAKKEEVVPEAKPKKAEAKADAEAKPKKTTKKVKE